MNESTTMKVLRGGMTIGAITMLMACSSPAGPGSTASAAAETQGTQDSSGWCHDALQASDGTAIDFDYQVAMSRTEIQDQPVWQGTADNSWLNVQKDSFSGSEEVDVTVVDYTYSAKFHYEGQYTQAGTYVVHLTWDPNAMKFTAPVGTSLQTYKLVEGDDDATMHMFEFATEVDGAWLTDPIRGGHNFRFIPDDQESGMCTGAEITPY